MNAKPSEVLNISLDDYIAEQRTDFSASFKRSEMEMDNYENDNEMGAGFVKVIEVNVQNKINSDPECHNSGETRDKGDIAFVNKHLNRRFCANYTSNSKIYSIIHNTKEKRRLSVSGHFENQVPKNPTGTFPIVTLKSDFERNTEQRIASFSENTNFRNVDARNRINQRLKNKQGQRQMNGHQSRNIWNNIYRYQYGKNPNMVPSFNPSFHSLPLHSSVPLNRNQITDLRHCIKSSSSLQSQGIAFSSNGPRRHLTQFAQPKLVTLPDMLNQISQTVDNQNREMFSNVISNVMHSQYQQEPLCALAPMMTTENLSLINSAELMPIAAQTLLNHITMVQQNFGPKYDMNLQKEIHSLQNKSLLYLSNGVVSTDGPGIENAQVNPVTTDISINMRFS